MAAKKTAVLLIIIIIIVIVLAYVFLVREKPPVGPPEGEEIIPPAATGEIDDVVDALLKETADETSILTEEEGDAGLVGSDGQEISDFGQSIDENEL